ncbi:MAG: hypothetical protein JNM41_06145 [Flavipsychrobacter sp.]|nr:hypothetical protein [Flavipsychrobacter sp.]
MRKFLLKLSIGLIPTFFILGVYIVTDPYKVLYHYDSYYGKDTRNTMTLCNGYIATQTFINNYKKEQYDSYIMGNSRSLFYNIADWSPHISSDKCYHFDAQLEPLWGIERKVRFLDKNGVKIKNLLMVIDESVLRNKPSENFYFTIKHPAISEKSYWAFQWHFLKTYLDRNMLENYIGYLFTHNPKFTSLFLNIDLKYDPLHNEIKYAQFEREIQTNPDSFYAARKHIFYDRDSTVQRYSKARIGADQRKLLQNIKSILDKHNTDVRIVISPLYNQEKLAKSDLAELVSIFGDGVVFDFSGINKFTQSKYNYYENSHYRSTVAKAIMDSIYTHRYAGKSAKL